jgi:hypothetical protein
MPNRNIDKREPQTEIDLLKAYLTINQELVAKEEKLITKIETLDTEEKLAAYLFYQPLIQYQKDMNMKDLLSLPNIVYIYNNSCSEASSSIMEEFKKE